MQIDIACKNMKLDAPLRVFVMEKMNDVARVLGDSKGAHVRVELSIPSKHHHTGPIFYAEANIDLGAHVLRANVEHYDLRSAIVQVKDELQVQVKKFKTKSKDLARRPKEA